MCVTGQIQNLSERKMMTVQLLANEIGCPKIVVFLEMLHVEYLKSRDMVNTVLAT